MNTKFLYVVVLEAKFLFPDDPALKNTISFTFAKVIVVPPSALNEDHVEPLSTEYYKVTAGGDPRLAILTVAPASSALT